MRFHRLHHAAMLAFVAALAAHPAAARTIAVKAGTPDANEKLQEALILAEPGDTVELGAGVWKLTDGLSLDVNNVTVRGAGVKDGEGSILDFSGQQGAGEGLLVTSDDVFLTDFAVLNTKGDGIKSKGADRIVYQWDFADNDADASDRIGHGSHIATMIGFHRRYMISNKICRFWVNMVRQLDVEMIVPQHGCRFEGKAMVNRFLDWIEKLECGVDLMTQDSYRAP